MIGSIFAGTLADKLGRKGTMMISDLFLIIGPFLLWQAETIPTLYIGRIMAGIGMGINIMVTTVYLSECSPTEIRGSISGVYILSNFFGVTGSYASGIIFKGDWASMFGIVMIPAII